MSLKSLRLKRGMTQQQLGEKVGMSQGTIANYETGISKVGNMTLATAVALGDALRVSNLRKLLDDDTPDQGVE